MSQKVWALGLASAVLVGCGSGSDSAGSVTEYDLSEYEGRTVATDTLAGTWVAIGTGSDEFSHSEGVTLRNRAVKEFFVIKDTGNGYTKPRCDYETNYNVVLEGDSIQVNDFVGTVTDNKTITGKIVDSYTETEGGEDYAQESITNLTIVKISDSVSAIAKVTANVNGETVEKDVFCYQQSNTAARFKSLSAKALEIETPVIELTRWVGDEGYTALDSYAFSVFWDTDDGDNISFDVNTDSSLSETVTFTASSGTNNDSVTGSIVVQLPVQ